MNKSCLKYKAGNCTEDTFCDELCPVADYGNSQLSNWKSFIDTAPNLPQRQDALNNQLKDLYYVANKLKFYDAADYLRKFV